MLNLMERQLKYTGIKNFLFKQLSTKTRENKIFHINLRVSGVSFKNYFKSVKIMSDNCSSITLNESLNFTLISLP